MSGDIPLLHFIQNIVFSNLTFIILRQNVLFFDAMLILISTQTRQTDKGHCC